LNAPGVSKRAVRLLITMGDPCGVGPELCVKALLSRQRPSDAALTIVGSLAVLRAAAKTLNADLALARAGTPADLPGNVTVLDVNDFPPELLSVRSPTADSGRASIDYIERAVRETMAGRADAIVTCPISKEAIGAAGSPYPGHTEMLAELTGGGKAVMLLIRGGLRVAFATTHLALRDVPEALTEEGICRTGTVLSAALKDYFDVHEPRIAVCALNPHGSDGGRFGDEEARIVEPAVERMRRAGVDVSGPYPSDTLFARAVAGEFDGVVALYHDQGMIPVKLGGLGDVVNVTLGLPIIRTSPGHGTAYDIAGKGIADEGSLMAAISLAAFMERGSKASPA